jgi:hypothetical protein
MEEEDIEIYREPSHLPKYTVHFDITLQVPGPKLAEGIGPGEYLKKLTIIEWASNPGEPYNTIPSLSPTAIFWSHLLLFIHSK